MPPRARCRTSFHAELFTMWQAIERRSSALNVDLGDSATSVSWPVCKISRTRQKASGHWVLQTRFSHLELFTFCEGFQTPAVTNIPHSQRPASENLQGTKPREGARIRRCPRAHYGDLGVGEPQLGQPRGSVER